ncbi:hypothetical protein F0562_010019 [Nyssa sinensis]|uniref:Uncharacterized protein n=1 Tax=Nyssa sinensis TaxID=561372 RepID=A0A5J5A0J2_9ASTE|nr:hypothetical protein F0562_010019 [Nyssa sinensis]
MDFSYQGKPPSPQLTAMSATYNTGSDCSPNYWYTDTGATNHITADLANLNFPVEYQGDDNITIANGQALDISHSGQSSIHANDHTFILNNVLCVPSMATNLLSVHQFCKDNHCRFIFDSEMFQIQDKATKQLLFQGPSDHGLYPLPTSSITKHSAPSPQPPLHFQHYNKHCANHSPLQRNNYSDSTHTAYLELQHDHHKNSVNSNDNDLTRLNTQFNTLNSEFKLVGSCNGLLCLIVCNNSSSGLRKTGRIYIVNPVIGEYMAVPPLSQRTRFTEGYGFGVNSAGNEYKVIRLWFRWIDYTGKRRPSFELVVEIYTLGLGTWRSIGNVPCPLNVKHCPSFVNGALRWTIDSYVSMGFSGIIVSFDVGGEEFRPLPHPPRSGRQDNDLLDLCVLGDHLCFLDRDFDDEFLVIWVMREYGVEESWKILYVVEQPWVTFGRPYHSDIICLNLAPLTLVNDREILFLVNGEGEKLICYDPQTKTYQVLGIQRLPHRFSVIPHVGSFVSLRSAGDTK